MPHIYHRILYAILSILVPSSAGAWPDPEPYLKTRTRIIGVQASPLSAYPELMRQHFPHGAPSRESGVVLDLLRAKKSQQMLGRSQIFGFGVGIGSYHRNQLFRSLRAQKQDARSLADFVVDAVPTSTDKRVQVDAIKLTLTGIDARKVAVALHGTVQATLYGFEDQHDRDHSIQDPQAFPLPAKAVLRRMAIWVRPISTGETAWQTTLRLPRTRPDTNVHWSRHGILNLNIAVPGVGVFEKRQQIELAESAVHP